MEKNNLSIERVYEGKKRGIFVSGTDYDESDLLDMAANIMALAIQMLRTKGGAHPHQEENIVAMTGVLALEYVGQEDKHFEEITMKVEM